MSWRIKGEKINVLNQLFPHEEQSLKITHFVSPKIITHKSQLNSVGTVGRNHFN